MNITRWVLIGITFIITAILTFNVYIWSDDFKHMFAYNDDYLSYIMIFALVISLTGIFKWLLKEEILLTNPKRKRRKK